MFPIFTSITLYIVSSLAFKIDASCDRYTYNTKDDNDQVVVRHLVSEAVDQAFDMADQALQALQKPTRDTNVNRLLRLLFGSDDSAVTVPTLEDTFSGILGMRNQNPNADQPVDRNFFEDFKEVVFYCNTDRLQENKQGKLVDTAIGQVIDPGQDSSRSDLMTNIKECSTVDGTLAFTTNPAPISIGPPDPPAPVVYRTRFRAAQVTICPWFLNVAGKWAYNNWRDMSKKARLAKWTIPLVSRGYPFAPIDALNLLDKVILHEMTHTVAGGLLEDIEMDSRLQAPFGVAYGWRAATQLAQVQPVDQGALKNADSLALFASGVRLLNQQDENGNSAAKYITDQGAITTNLLAKRQFPPELEYPSTPAAFEGFLTMIREENAAASLAAEAQLFGRWGRSGR